MLKKFYRQHHNQQRAAVLFLSTNIFIIIITIMLITATLCSKRIMLVQGTAATTAARTGFMAVSSTRRRFLSPTSSTSAFLSSAPRQPWMIRPKHDGDSEHRTKSMSSSSSSLLGLSARRSSSSTRGESKMKIPPKFTSPSPPPRSPMRMPATASTTTTAAIAAPSSLLLPQPSIMTKTKKQQTRRYRVSSPSNTSAAAAAKTPLSAAAAPAALAPLPNSISHDFSNNTTGSKSSSSNKTRRGGGSNSTISRMADPQKTYILRVKGISTGKRRGVVSTGSTGIGFVLLEADDNNNANDTSTTAVLALEDCWIASSLYLEGSRSVFEAAYTAIIMGLQHAATQRHVRNIILQIDHDVIYKQLMGEFKVIRESLVPMYWKIMQFKECYFQNNNKNNINNNGAGSSSSFTIQYISPQHNEIAKNLSTRALGTQTSQTLLWAQPDYESCNTNNDNENVNIIADPMMIQMTQLLMTNNYSTSSTPPPPPPPHEQTIIAATASQTRATHTLTTTTLEGQTDEDEETTNTTTKETESSVYNDEEQGGGGGLYNDDGASTTIDIDPSKTYLLQFDGGARGNPGIAGGGMVLYDYEQQQSQTQAPQEEVWCGWEFFSTKLSNNQAEYQSLIRGLQAARALGIRHLIVQGDSELIVKQLKGIYRVKNENLRLYFSQVQALIRTFETFQITHIRRAQNARADALANHAMDHQESHHGLLLPSSSSFHQNVEVPPVLLKQQKQHSATRSEKNNAVAIQKRQMSSFAALELDEDSDDENDDGDREMSTILLGQLMNPSIRYVFHPEQALSYDVPGLCSGQTTNDDENNAAMGEETLQRPTESISDSNDTRDATLVSIALSTAQNNTNATDDENCNVTETKPPLPSLEVLPASVVNSMASDTVATASLDIDSSKKYRLQFDGGSRGNPGLAGAGMVLYNDDTGKEIWCGCKYLGKDMTSNQAEYSSLLLGLEAAQSLGINQLIVEGDSELIVRQINGIYKVRNAKLREYYQAVQERIQKLDSFQIQQIPRAQNARADELANQAMDTIQSSDGLEDPLSLLPQRQRCTSMDIDPSKKYRLQFDGGFRGKFGVAGGGMVLYDDEAGKEIWWGYKYMGKHLTSNQAEYSSLLLGLEAAQSMGVNQLTVEGDSELIVRQINGLYKVRNAKLREYYQAIQDRIKKLNSFQIQLIPRAQNRRAEDLAYQAMDTHQSSDGLEDPSLLLLQ